MPSPPVPKGDKDREAIDSLRGYVYQIYQSALAWMELGPEEFLFLEVAEDYAVAAAGALKAVQVKETKRNVTINSNDIVASIDSFVDLRRRNPELKVRLRHLTTSMIGKEGSVEDRIGNIPTLETWRKLAKAGKVDPLRKILYASKLSKQTKDYIHKLDDAEFREEFLKRINFDCGALDSIFLVRQLRSKLSELVIGRGGANSQVDGCLSSIIMALLHKAIQKEDRFVDRSTLEELLERATQVPVNRAQWEEQNRLINKALAAPDSQITNLISARLGEPKPINEVPLPAALASRAIQIDNISSSLTQYGVGWIFGAAGVGKTIGAKIAARRIGGNWAGINLRGLNAEQVNGVLSSAIDRFAEQEIDGVLIDDLECSFEPHIVDILLYLQAICNRTDLLLLVTSPRPLSPGTLFSFNLPASIEQKFEEFSEGDIREILAGLGVQDANWAKYLHLVSGGGHPQLAIAAIQNMQSNGWDTNEFRTMDSILVGNQAIEQVRALTRERLLNELPEGGRILLERLSLKSGSFRRNFVLDMTQVAPAVPDGGIVFDQLIGSWVDQQERDRFALSPLLSNYAANTLTDRQKLKINFEIASSLVKGRSLNPIEANSALLAALSGKNTQVIVRLCMAVLGADRSILEMIAPHLLVFTLMRTDTFAYEDDPVVSQMFRGAQLLLLCHEEGRREKTEEALDRFEKESDRVGRETEKISMALPVYVKLLISEPKFGALPKFWELVRKLDILLENQNETLPPELLRKGSLLEVEGVPLVGFLFAYQARQIKLIADLLTTFEFLNSCGQELRQKALNSYNTPNYELDMLVSGAWLSEHDANTIDPPSHSEVFSRLEEFAKSWDNKELAICCRKYRAIIIDEYGGDKDQALVVLDEGLYLYGESNSELVRAKARVLYRAEDHQGSLELSKALLDGDNPLSEIEKAFLGRDAAISAEKQGEYETAKRYYLYGSAAAGNCSVPNMRPMRVGLMADSALASWHAGDRETCLQDFAVVLSELKNIDPKFSLRAAHCHAVCRHVLLWLDQDATGEKRLLPDGEETTIYPGIVSNPEPHSEIGERFITPIEMAWYMLATVENHCYLDVGITQNLGDFLPKGPTLEGQFHLTPSKMRKSLALLDTVAFVEAIMETIAELAYFKEQGNSFNIEKLTYGSLPVPTLEQQTNLTDLSEQFVICFASNCIFRGCDAKFDHLVKAVNKGHGFKVRKVFLSCLQSSDTAADFNSSIAILLNFHKRVIHENETPSPAQVFELAFKSLQIASKTRSIRVIAKAAFEWLNMKWVFIWERQRFLLRSPALHEKSIAQALIAGGESEVDKVINLLQAILPTMGFTNEKELKSVLNGLREAER